MGRDRCVGHSSGALAFEHRDDIHSKPRCFVNSLNHTLNVVLRISMDVIVEHREIYHSEEHLTVVYTYVRRNEFQVRERERQIIEQTFHFLPNYSSS